MKNLNFFISVTIFMGLFASSCTKEIAAVAPSEPQGSKSVEKKVAMGDYITHTIVKGGHYSNYSGFKSIKLSEMKFVVIFDSSAIYTTVDPSNQSDINKLYGFSEGYNNQYNSARIGWVWQNNDLNLYAYVYNKGVRASKKITNVAIGTENACSIKVSGTSYIFNVNGVTVTLGRGNKTTTVSGLQQYPYFGGDETAPHTITIRVKNG